MPTHGSAIDLHATASVATSFRQQIFLLAVSRRWLYLAGSLLLAIPLIGFGGAQSRPYMFVVAAAFALIGGSLWTLGVWRGEAPARRGYHWSLPVSRTGHELARVCVGGIQLIGACAILAGAVMLTAARYGTLAQLTAMPAVVWASFFIAPLILYLLASPVVLWSEYAATRWAIGVWIALTMTAMLLDGALMRVMTAALDPIFFDDVYGLAHTIFEMPLHAMTDMLAGTTSAAPAGWWRGVALWIGVGAVVNVFAARYRPDDLKRLLRGG